MIVPNKKSTPKLVNMEYSLHLTPKTFAPSVETESPQTANASASSPGSNVRNASDSLSDNSICYYISLLNAFYGKQKKYCKLHIIIAPNIGAFYMAYVRAVVPLHHIFHSMPGAIGTYTIHMQ